MATPIDKKLIHFNKEEYFKNALKNGQLKDSSIAFVGDHDSAVGKKIYTHGETYITHYEGVGGVEVVEDKIGLFSENLLYFETTQEFDALVAKIGEDGFPIPCVIFINDSGSIIYNE